MLDPNVFIDFHFLRPAWLLALLPVVMVWLIVGRRGDVIRQWRKVIAPHLLAHLSVGSQDRWRFRPLHLTILVLLLGIIGLAGPTWEREISPFAEDTAPLIIVLDLSASMNAADVQPTRLKRAKQKVRDLLSLRSGSRSALIAYAGSSHTLSSAFPASLWSHSCRQAMSRIRLSRRATRWSSPLGGSRTKT